MNLKTDSRFAGIEPFNYKIWLASPTMHGEEQKWVDDAIQTNWVSTVGENINAVEEQIADYLGCKYAVGLSCGTAALHLAVRLAGERLYGPKRAEVGVLNGHKVFCSDMTFAATVNPVCYEGGECIFIDSEYESWNMDPVALEKAFEIYPDVKLIIVAHLYGTPGKIDEIRNIADKHGALIVEDAAESLGATYKGIQTGMFGDYSVISFNGNKIITGSAGGMLITDFEEDAHKIRKWSTQAREHAAWYQHEELGYNYRMSNIVAGVVRGQIPYLEQHIEEKKRIWERYRDGLKDLPISMNPIPDNCTPNYWLSCILVDDNAMCDMVRSEKEELWKSENEKSCPGEILAVLKAFNIEGRPIWKPMHMQPIYRGNVFISVDGIGRGRSNAYIQEKHLDAVVEDVFRRGLCLPSDNKMSEEEQNKVIEIIYRCFQ